MIINSSARDGQNPMSEAEAQMLRLQHEVVSDFFKRDGSEEIVNSLNTMIEAFLFTENMEDVAPEMRVHIANNLRVVTLITKLGQTRIRW
ncbi:hypothetical protein [Dyadobacter arcticus]|uniref:Uncharacterized protein n=1 Tax=Dyadobacter arcticus TaxID=1078754 RepID=A0ABX0UTY6_9BACT|nr:hypothetical protein [Dyadobacter arcticus]NIJ55260.1 hypothetical protein [Dyadobacter arcticus]